MNLASSINKINPTCLSQQQTKIAALSNDALFHLAFDIRGGHERSQQRFLLSNHTLSELLDPLSSALLTKVGERHTERFIAVWELFQRLLSEKMRKAPIMEDPQSVRKFLQSKMLFKEREVFGVIYLDAQHKAIHYEEIFEGSINVANVYPRVIVHQVLKRGASAVILAHNHPSGNAQPSQADRQITDRIKQALSLIDVEVLDHVVVGKGELTSFAEHDWL